MSTGKKKEVSRPGASLLIFRLDGALFNGHEVLKDAVKSVLKEYKISLTPLQFSKYVLSSGLGIGLARLLRSEELRDVDYDKLSESMKAALAKGWKGSTAKPQAQIVQLLRAALDHNIKLAAWSGTSEEVAQDMLVRLGLPAGTVRHFLINEMERDFPRMESWQWLARNAGAEPVVTAMVTETCAENRSALAAGLRTLVVSDSHTAFQDFGGADYLAESAEEIDVKGAMVALLPV